MIRTPGAAIEVMLSVADSGDAFESLDDVLWQERRLLERLAYRLTAQLAVLSLGETRWLALSDSEVTAAVRDLRAHEVVRAAETEQLLRRLRRPARTTLAQLAALAPTPWSAILDDHREAMRELETGMRATAAKTVALLESLAADPTESGADT